MFTRDIIVFVGGNNPKTILADKHDVYRGNVRLLHFIPIKGGRTLSWLSFAKAWSAQSPKDYLLIIDSDIEAPSITWQEDIKTDIY